MKYFSFSFLSILFFITLISALAFVRAFIPLMNKFGIVDRPSHRRAHEKITPRGAGVSLVLIFSILMPISEFYTLETINYSQTFLQILIPLALISFWDDIYHVSIPIRLFFHIFCSCLAVMWLISPHRLLHQELPQSIDLAASSFALLTFLNIYNFMDGIDGITPAESIHLAITILALCFLRKDLIPNVTILMIMATIVLAWSIGFMFFNWPPAKIFIGDVGSISLGFILGICLMTIATASEHLFVACVIASLYYIADGGITILIRLSRGEKIWQPHLQHFFQKAVRNGKSHKQVTVKIMQCNLILMLLAINSLYYPILSIIMAIITIIVTMVKLMV